MSWENRDGKKYMTNYAADKEILNAVLKINARKAGTFTILGGSYYWLYDDADHAKNDAEFDTSVPKGDGFSKALRLETMSNAPSGYTSTIMSWFTVAPPFESTEPRDYITYTLVGVDIDVDSNNDGNNVAAIEGTNGWNSGEDFYEAHPANEISDVYKQFKRGMLVGVNDGDLNANGQIDNGWNGSNWSGPEGDTIQTDASGNDGMRPMIIRSLGLTETQKAIIQGAQVNAFAMISGTGSGAIRVFTTDGDLVGIFDGDTAYDHIGSDELFDLIWSQDTQFRIEGLRAGTVELCVSLATPTTIIHEDKVTITVTDCSLKIFKRDGTTVVADEKKFTPGAFIAYNNDDDDADGGGTGMDKDDDSVAGEDDLVKATFEFDGPFDTLQLGKVIIERANAKVKLWKQQTKGTDQEIVFTDNRKVYDLSVSGDRTAFASDIKGKTLWVEGVQASTALRDTSVAVIYESAPNVTIVKDFTSITVVDSALTIFPGDGSAALGLDKEVDPGAYVWLNRDDDDEDNTEDRSDNATAGENDLVKVRFGFGSLFDSLDRGKVVVKRNNDKVKLWSASTKGASSEIPFTSNKIEYDLSTSSGRTAFAADLRNKDLYVEGYDTSASLKDTELSLVYEDGDTTSKDVCVDPVKLTIFRLEVTQMSFNHDRTAHTADGVNIRKSYTASTEITAPEWQVDGADAGTDPDKHDEVLYLKGKRVTVKVSFSITPAVASAKVRAIGSRTAIGGSAALSIGNLGHAQDQDVSWETLTFTSGQASDVSFVPKNATSGSVLREEARWQWVTNEIGGVAISPMAFTPTGQGKPIIIYTILGAPISPWDTSDTAGDDRTQPWVSGLAFAIDTHDGNNKGQDAALSAITTSLEGSLSYLGAAQCLDTVGGTTYFSYTDYMSTSDVNCLDSAMGLSTTGKLLGINLLARRRTLFFGYNFHCFTKIAVGGADYVYDCCPGLLRTKQPYADYITDGSPDAGSVESTESYPIK